MNRASWLRDARVGLMCHYLDSPASGTKISTTTADEWNRRVDGFELETFAAHVRETGVRYLIFTLGQNSGHYCSPNAVYDELTGITPSKLSRRDLIAEIADALAPEIKVIAYLSSHAAAHDADAVRSLRLTPSWDGSRWGTPPITGYVPPTDEKLTEFQHHWEAIASHWAQRWGERVAGWWIDGCYFAETMYNDATEPNFTSFARALRTGNEARIIAFNRGTAKPFEVLTKEADYTAGEVSTEFPVHNKWQPLTGASGPLQTHVLSYLGTWWGEGETRFPDEWVRATTHYLNQHDVPITWDVPITRNGHLADAFRRQLAGLHI